MTHLAVYTLPFTLQLCYKTLGILTSVTKSQKVHISSHNVLQKSHTCEEGGAHMRIVFYGIYWWNLKKPKNQNFCKNEKKKKNAGDIINTPENQNFEKMKKAFGDVIISNLCNKKYNQMMYAYSDMECERHNFLSFQTIFCSFTPLLTQKIKL